MRPLTHIHRHVIAPLLIVVAVLVATTGTAGAATGFGDVDDDAFYADAVAWMVDSGITTGIESGCFGPGEPISRGQVAAFLYRLDAAVGNAPVAIDHPFLDVVHDYQTDAVGWLFGAGVTTGTSPVSFDPDGGLTRGDLATLLWRYAGEPGGPGHPFTDVDYDYQATAVGWMAAQGITQGTTPTTFDPHAVVTRAEAAAFLFRFASPGGVARPTSTEECSRTLRAALTAGGLTETEAACAAPWLTDFSVDYLTRVVADLEPASFELILAIAIINDEGCLSDQRLGQLSRLYL